MMTNKILRVLGWALPILAMTGGSFATYSQFTRMKAAEEARAAADREVDDAGETLAGARRRAQSTKLRASAPAVEGEGVLFLEDLRRRAAATNVKVSSWRGGVAPVAANQAPGTPAAPPPPEPGAAPMPEDPRTALLARLSRVTSEIVLTGSYRDLRDFLDGFSRSTRLYTISSAEWERAPSDEPGTVLTMSVSRYVETPAPTPTAPAAPATSVATTPP